MSHSSPRRAAAATTAPSGGAAAGRAQQAPPAAQAGPRGRAHPGRGGKGGHHAPNPANQVIRDAKGLSAELSSLLKHHDPWDREIQFQRESLRKVYLSVLFAPFTPLPVPDAVSSNGAAPGVPTVKKLDVINSLWLDTSHALIHAYRGKLSEMDKAIAHAGNKRGSPARRGGQQQDEQQRGGRSGPPGPTARRRLIHSFRQFLAQEEEFFRALLSRFARDLYPSDLIGLRPLGVTVAIDASDAAADDVARPRELEILSASADKHAGEDAELSPEEKKDRREKVVPLAHKALICIGDLARYRELYNEPNGKKEERGGGGGGGKRGGGDKKNGPAEKRVKNWARAAECYHQARILLPDFGNPSNQLAVLANYAQDNLSATYHYYRAISVRSPFPTSRTNLEVTYQKGVHRWFSEEAAAALQAKGPGEIFKQCFVALQGIYFTKTHLSDLPPLEKEAVELFSAAVKDRLLTSDYIVKVVVTGISALSHARMHRGAGTSKRSNDAADKPKAPVINLEPRILVHILSLFQTLLSVGAAETYEVLASKSTDPAGGDASSEGVVGQMLAQNISAVLRRMLPALRILSKWLLYHIDYISRAGMRVEIDDRARAAKEPADEPATGPVLQLSEWKAAVAAFWSAYATMANALSKAFPSEQLPASVVKSPLWLEEDVDMLGYIPLRRGLKDASSVGGKGQKEQTSIEIARVGTDVHPNEEQLMRISDIEDDQSLIADSDACPFIVYEQGQFVCLLDKPVDASNPANHESTSEADKAARRGFGVPAPPRMQGSDFLAIYGGGDGHYEENLADEDGFAHDEMAAEDELSEDDPVDLAMRVATANRASDDGDYNEFDDDEDEEEILYPAVIASMRTDSSYARPNHVGTPAARNAADLLHQVLAGGVPLSGPRSSPPPAHGMQAATSPGQSSIWGAPVGQPGGARQSFESIPNQNIGTIGGERANATGSPQGRGSISDIWGPSMDANARRSPLGPFAPHEPFSFAATSNNGAPPAFGGFSPFAPIASNNAPAPPQPVRPAYSAALSDLSPHANPFSARRPSAPAEPDWAAAGKGTTNNQSFQSFS